MTIAHFARMTMMPTATISNVTARAWRRGSLGKGMNKLPSSEEDGPSRHSEVKILFIPHAAGNSCRRGRGSSRRHRVSLRSPWHRRQQRRGGPSHADLHVSRFSAGVSAAARRPQGGHREGRGGGHRKEVGGEHAPELAALFPPVHLRPPEAAGG